MGRFAVSELASHDPGDGAGTGVRVAAVVSPGLPVGRRPRRGPPPPRARRAAHRGAASGPARATQSRLERTKRAAGPGPPAFLALSPLGPGRAVSRFTTGQVAADRAATAGGPAVIISARKISEWK
jgi:hypothetical protein